MITFADELSGIYAATAITRSGREIYTEGDAEEVSYWVRQVKRAERGATIEVREMSPDECHGVWSSPGA